MRKIIFESILNYIGIVIGIYLGFYLAEKLWPLF